MNSEFKYDMSKQPIMNVGMLGSVSDGKSTCVRVLTGIKTQRHSSEKTRNITIKPGYANMKIWQKDDTLESTDSKPSNYKDFDLVHHLSFVDCPGHHELILTMLGSIKLMNAVIVVVAASEPINMKPQLIQHLAAIKLAGIKNVIVCLNKLDLIEKELAFTRYKELQLMLQKFNITPKCIIPTSFSKGIGVEWLLNEILEHFSVPEDEPENATFMATRSFDINKPGISWDKVSGGVIGGSLFNGKLNVGDTLEIRPGIVDTRNCKCIPITTQVLSFQTDQEKLNSIRPGGLIGIGTDVDSYYCKDDYLSGNIIGLKGTLPSVYSEIELKYNLTEDFGANWKPRANDVMSLQIGALTIESMVLSFSKKSINFKLSRPACVDRDSMIIICHKEDGIMKIVGVGNIKSGKKLVD